MIKVSGLDHVAISVRDLDRSLEFYTKVLGLSITQREYSKPGIEYFLDCGPSLVGLIQGDEKGAAHKLQDGGLGGNHVSFRVKTRDFDGIVEELKARKITITFEKKREKSWSVYFLDPDGNKLEMTAWPLEDKINLRSKNNKEGFFMTQLKEGVKAPEFALPASNGKQIALKDFRSKNRVVLYFYPKDDTPGCTVEACEFRDSVKKIQKTDTVVLGISPDGVVSHNKFIDKFKLPFILLSDEDKAVCKAYGVWVKKSMYGREYMGVARTTFIIGKDGKTEKIFEKVKPEGHADEVLGFLKS